MNENLPTILLLCVLVGTAPSVQAISLANRLMQTNINTSTVSDPNWSSVAFLLPMDGANDSTTFTDVKGNTFTAGGGAAISQGTAKFGGSSGLFGTNGGNNGTGTYLNCTSTGCAALGGTSFINPTATFTVEMWVNLTGSTASQAGQGSLPAGIGDYQANSGWNLYWIFGIAEDGSVSFAYNDSSLGYQLCSSNGYPGTNNGWHHIAMTMTSGAINLFMDGVHQSIQGSHNNCTITHNVAGTYSAIMLGGRGGYTFPGSMDEVRLTSGVVRYTGNYTPASLPFPTH